MEKVIDENKPKELELKVGDYVYSIFRNDISRARIARTTKTMAIDNKENKYDIVAKHSALSNHYEVRKKGTSYEKWHYTSYFLEDDDLLLQYKIQFLKFRVSRFNWNSINDIETLTKISNIIDSIENDKH